MKPAILLFVIYLLFGSIETSEQSIITKLEEESSNDNYRMTLMGFGNYEYIKETRFQFKTIFKSLQNITFDKYLKIRTNITYFTNNSDPDSSALKETNANCTKETTNLYKDFASYDCIISNINISNINIVKIDDNFMFLNNSLEETNSSISIRKEIKTTSLSDISIENIINDTRELFIFTLTENIEGTKFNQFILKGNMHKKLNDEKFEFKYDDTNGLNGILKCENDNNFEYECTLSPTSKISDKIDSKEANSAESKIFIIGNEIKESYITFPRNDSSNKTDVTIFSVGNFKRGSNTEDAKGKVFLRGGINELLELKEYMNFSVKVNYETNSNLRILDDDIIQVKGKKNTSELYKGIVSYDVNYINTGNRTILKIHSPSNIRFFEDSNFTQIDNDTILTFIENENYNFLEEIDINYIVMKHKGDKDKDARVQSDSFSYEFETDDNITNLNKTAVVVSYVPYNEIRSYETCDLLKKGKDNIYTIICYPKRNIYALISSLKIDVTDLVNSNINRRLKSTEIRILQEKNPNSTIIPDSDNDGVIEYIYNPKTNIYPPKKNSGGLSGGEITAIVLASLFAVLIVLGILFLLNRPPTTVLKNNSEIGLGNSSANINN